MSEALQERLNKLREHIKSGKWVDPHSPSYTNGYDRAIKEEIQFLENLFHLEAIGWFK